MGGFCVRVGAGVGHGELEWLVVGELEVLVGKLLAVDGFAAGALGKRKGVSECACLLRRLLEDPMEMLSPSNGGYRRSLTLPRVKSPP